MLEYNILNMEIEFFHYKCKKCNSVMKSKVKLNFCQNCGIKYDVRNDIIMNDIELLKENIVDTSPKLADLMQVKVRNYNLIGETTRQIGVVAQELETVFPAMIDESSDRDKEGNDLGTTTKSVKYSVFVPMLIKAIQELKAINDTQAETINALTARIVALESK